MIKPFAKCFFVCLLLIGASSAFAARLEPGPEASYWIHIGAALLLIAHIGGGTVGLVSGTVAVSVRKGHRLHRLAGKIFVGSMLITYLIGAGVAPFLYEGQRPNFVAGILALYLLISGVMAAKRRNFTAGLRFFEMYNHCV